MAAKKRGKNFTSLQRMGLIEAIKIHEKVVEDKRSDTSALAKKQKAWEDIAKRMAANFPERPKSTAKDLRELWRRMKMKAKKVAREKKLNLQKTGGGQAEVEDLDEEIIAILSIISADLEQVHSDVDDDATTPNSPTAIDNDVETAATDNMQPVVFTS